MADVKAKIRKLRALAASPANEHEAASAAALAAELQARHQLAEAELAEAPPDAVLLDSAAWDAGATQLWRSILLQGVTQGLGCRGYTQRVVTEANRRRKVIYRVVGPEQAVPVAISTYRDLNETILRLAREGYVRACEAPETDELGAGVDLVGAAIRWLFDVAEPPRAPRRRPPKRAWTNAFLLAAATRIADRMIARRAEVLATGSPTALARIADGGAALDTYLAGLGARMPRQSSARRSVDAGGYRSGAAAGDAVALPTATGALEGAPDE